MITEKVLLELLNHEAIVRTAYKDSVGVWTWSVGITSASGHNVERYINNEQTMEQCLRIFVWAAEKYAKEVERAFTRPLTESQFAAALSFHYNTGAIAKASWVKSFNAGNVAKAKAEIMNWVTPKEITKRRKAERDLFFDGKWTTDGKVTEYKTYKNGNVNWSSGKRIDIRDDLRKAMNGPKEVEDKNESPWYVELLSWIASFFVLKEK